ncbi:MAG: XdhC family protein [Pseudotabrizicola sp.]|uniref:XdhC family protein n=1 Tax=Pseudotabrizicola sp. TaxID=2939647 RepID=UPI002727E48F|nr:XdhC family protein [Pseudotabrizicola sp.]MDO8881973.1 XdhC family protein [Pseudotabrizicola sp.]MDP2079794.1 XdhC family protein [Pseudotabrizicola sp.]MDZ7574795.1 XdhC family protein [Pseudotabrizicola sp.]
MTAADHDRIPEIALDWHRAGRGAALATVVETWGSAPRQAGSQLAISGAGDIMGSVSGGCVEGAVVTEALEAMADGVPRLLTYGVSDDSAFAVGLACGGTIRVLVEPVGEGGHRLPPDLLGDLVAARAARLTLGYTVTLDGWVRSLVAPGQDGSVDARLRSDKSGMEQDGRFIAVQNPPLRLIVVGAVHIAQPLLSMARACGYAPTLIDPRGAFGSAERFPGEVILDDWPDEAMTALAPDARTAVVTLTHDSKLDDPAILAALASPCFYLGCLGSTRTHAKRLDRLRNAGVPKADIARIHAPVGLDIGAKTPAEIAVSILAQITLTLRRGA